MAFEPKPNTGSLFKNEYKKTESHPDMKGDLFIDRGLLENLLEKSNDSKIKMAISAWPKEYGGGKKMLSLTVGEPYEKPKSSNPWE